MAKTILVVDDTEALLANIAHPLQLEGYNVLKASSAKIALGLLSETTPDLIITDLMMRDMTGFDLIEAVRKRPEWRNVTIVVYSAMPARENEKKVMALGADLYLKKPSTLEALMNTVNMFLHG